MGYARTRRRRGPVAALAALVMIVGIVGAGTVASGAWFTAAKSTAASIAGALLSIGEIGATSEQKTISVADVYPMTDEQAAAGARSEWITVRNTGTIPLDWNLALLNPKPIAPLTAAQLANFRFQLFTETGTAISTPSTFGTLTAAAGPDSFRAKGTALAAGTQAKVQIKVWLSTASENEFQGSRVTFDVFVNAIQNGAGGMPSTAMTLTATKTGSPSGTSTGLSWNDVSPALRAAGISGEPTYTVERSTTADFAGSTVVYTGQGTGSTDSGQIARTTPTSGRFADVTTDGFHGCVVTLEGAVFCGGQGYPGNGGPYSDLMRADNAQVTGGLIGKKAVKVDTTLHNNCALTDTGQLYCWGNYPGDGTKLSLIPVLANTGVLTGKKITQFGVVSGGGTCALASDNTIGCWGPGFVTGFAAQSGPAGWGGGSTVAVGMNLGSIVGKTISQLSVGATHTCVLATDSSVHCWGVNMNGELGASTAPMVEAFSPIRVNTPALNGATIRKLTTGALSTCILTSTGAIWCWGWMGAPWAPSEVTWKNLGMTPTRMASVTGVSDIVGTTSGLCALANAKAYCWGGDYLGIVGNGGDINKNIESPTLVAGVASGESIAAIRLNGSSSFPGACILTTDGRAACWGASSYTGAALTTTTSDVAGAAPLEFVRSVDGSTICPTGSKELSPTSCSLVASGGYFYRVTYTVAGVTGWVSPAATAARS